MKRLLITSTCIIWGVALFRLNANIASAQVATDFYGQAVLLAEGAPETPGNENKGPQGTINFYQTTSGGSRVTIEMAGLKAGSTYTVQVRASGCNGATLANLSSGPAQADGTIRNTTNIPNRVQTNSDHVTLTEGDPATGNVLLCGKIATIMTLGGGSTPPPSMPSTGDALGATLFPAAALDIALLALAAGISLRKHKSI